MNTFICMSILLGLGIISVTADHDVRVEIGSTPSSRSGTDSSVSSKSLIPDQSAVTIDAGKVVGFKYYSSTADLEVKFQIWRLESGTTYTLIHQTDTVTTADTGTQTYRTVEDDGFAVLANDTVGIAIMGNNPLSYSTITCTVNTLTPLTGSKSVGEGDSITFSRESSECREFSLTAIVIYDSDAVVSLACTQLVAEDGWKTMTSAGYDGSTYYAVSINECWTIQVDSNHTASNKGSWGVQIQIQAFNLEDVNLAGTCTGDTVTFKDGLTVFSPMLQELCGNTTVEYINGTTDTMYIRMYTDSNDLTVGVGFSMRYRVYLVSSSGTPNWVLALGIIAVLIVLVPIGIVLFLWCRLKKQRDSEDKEKLTDGEVNNGFMDNRSEDDFEVAQRNRSRMRTAKVDPMMMKREKSLYVDPKGPVIRVDAHKDANLKEHIPDDRIPQASDYRAPRNNNKKMKHWSKIGSGITD